METRIGVIGIVLEDNCLSKQVNEVLHEYSHIIAGRMGLPYKEKNVAVISLIVDGSADEISALTGKVGRIHGVIVKSALAKQK